MEGVHEDVALKDEEHMKEVNEKLGKIGKWVMFTVHSQRLEQRRNDI